MAKNATIRLNKVLRELNISLDRAVDYLTSQGHEVDARPTTKISDEIYQVLLEEFQTDKSKKVASKEVGEEKRKEKEAIRLQQEKELEEMHHRYTGAAPPRQGEKATAAYRLRLMYLDRWNLWRPLTRYRTWQGPQGETVDGTNNGCERAIGWWVKERYRTMRGYKRPKSAVNVSRLLAWCGNHLDRGGARPDPARAEPGRGRPRANQPRQRDRRRRRLHGPRAGRGRAGAQLEVRRLRPRRDPVRAADGRGAVWWRRHDQHPARRAA